MLRGDILPTLIFQFRVRDVEETRVLSAKILCPTTRKKCTLNVDAIVESTLHNK